MGVVNFLFFVITGGATYGLWKLLHLPSKPIEHFVCSVYSSTYPPHSEDWSITHYIRIFRGLLWFLFGISSFSALLGFIGIIAAIGVLFSH